MVMLVPLGAVGALCLCTQYVSPTDARYWWTIVCAVGAVPTVRVVAVSQSLPTPNTHELARVVSSVAVGAPGRAFALPVAPIAPDPFVPDAFTPVKVTTVIEA